MNNVSSHGREYEPTIRMSRYQEGMEKAVFKLNCALDEFAQAGKELGWLNECPQLEVYANIIDEFSKMADKLADAIVLSFEDWQTDDNTLANHHFWSEVTED